MLFPISQRNKYVYTLKIPTLLCLSFAIFSFGCAGGKDGDEWSCDNSSADGYQTITDGDVTRDYILQLPSDYDATVEYPLVISFHGNGGCAEMFSSGSDFGDGFSDLSSQADANGFIVQISSRSCQSQRRNRMGLGDNGSTDMNDNDVYFTQQLIAEISANHSIDSTRTYAVGYSNGGMIAYHGFHLYIGQ